MHYIITADGRNNMNSYYCKDKNLDGSNNVYSTENDKEVCVLVCDNCQEAVQYCQLLMDCESKKGRLNKR